MAEGARHFLDSFNDPEAVARYTEGPRRFVPGLDGLHRMTDYFWPSACPTTRISSSSARVAAAR